MNFSSFGIVNYAKDGSVFLSIEQDISDYYMSLIPKYIWTQPTKYPAHITIVRGGVEKPNFLRWGLDNGAVYSYTYSPEINKDGKYFYLNAFSLEIGLLRNSLGLEEFRKGFKEYHITIGRIKQ